MIDGSNDDRRPLLRGRSSSGAGLLRGMDVDPSGVSNSAGAGAGIPYESEANARRRAGAAAASMARDHPGADSRDSRFECNICLDHVNEPVVTRCGHLFCWPCLYRWLNTNHTECPVCKAGVSCDNVIPLYGRGQDPVDPRTKTVDRSAENIPERPTAERPRAERPRGVFGEGFGFGGGGGGGANEFAQGGMTITAGFGFFPSLFALQFQRFTSAPAGAQAPADSEDAAQQAMLSRILLALGTFVVACLLLF